MTMIANPITGPAFNGSRAAEPGWAALKAAAGPEVPMAFLRGYRGSGPGCTPSQAAESVLTPSPTRRSGSAAGSERPQRLRLGLGPAARPRRTHGPPVPRYMGGTIYSQYVSVVYKSQANVNITEGINSRNVHVLCVVTDQCQPVILQDFAGHGSHRLVVNQPNMFALQVQKLDNKI
jgi:hypothetical protein